MQVTFYNVSKTVITTKEEKISYKEVLYEAISEHTDLLLDGAYYRVRGFRVGLPVDNPTEITVTLEWLRKEIPNDDYC